MAKFKLAIVKKGKEALWRSYWIDSGTHGSSKPAPSDLGRTDVVEAIDVNEAIAAVQHQHPDCTVMLAGREHVIN